MTLEQLKSRMMFAERTAQNAYKIWSDLWDISDNYGAIDGASYTRDLTDHIYRQAKAEYETAAQTGESL
jgi:hypothetical protein